MRPAGLEPATYGFEVRYSIQVSYERFIGLIKGLEPVLSQFLCFLALVIPYIMELQNSKNQCKIKVYFMSKPYFCVILTHLVIRRFSSLAG